MPVNEPLDLERILDLVTYAMSAAYLSEDTQAAAAALLTSKNPTMRELSAARRENQEVHGGGAPIIIPGLREPSPTPEAVVIMRERINDILAAAERRLESIKY